MSAAPAFDAAPYAFRTALSLSRELDLSLPLAVVLVRRGLGDADVARRFLAGEELPEPRELGGVGEAAADVAAAIAAGRRITVFGDFDVDGVCATAILVGALRGAGADCDWLIPDRQSEGYGLGPAAVEHLAERGTSLLLTVDNGIGSAAEVSEAQRAGIEVIVTDHHTPGSELPPCRVVHPRLAGYSCPDLCGAAVAWKLRLALGAELVERGDGDGAADADLDLVALATVADLVPLRGENRELVRRGLAVARRGRRPGLRALAAAADCRLDALDEGDLGYRLGPRINAAGRLYRADAGVELLLTSDPARAAEIATELGQANRERRAVERQVAEEAEAAHRAQPPELRDGAAVVVAGRGWHPGVVGIVASRLVEEHGRPAVAISIDASGAARGSGRSVPGFDLVGALEACAVHLRRFGGHRAAAGLELEEGEIDAFARAFEAHALDLLGPGPHARPQPIDAIVAGADLGLEMAAELRSLAPFGIGNPAPCLLVPGARVSGERKMGDGGRHVSFHLASGGYRAKGVAFGRSTLGVEDGAPADLAVRLERNEWNGAVEPRVRLREAWPLAGPDHAYVPQIGEGEWWERYERAVSAGPEAVGDAGPDSGETVETTAHRPGSTLAAIAELLSAGEPVLAVAADAGRRAGLVHGREGLARFCDGRGEVVSARDSTVRIEAALGSACPLVLTDHAALGIAGAGSARSGHLVEVDPAASPGASALAREAVAPGGLLHAAWGEPERRFARRVAAERLDLRAQLARLYRELRDAGGELSGAGLLACLRGPGSLPRDPELAGRLAAVLCEAGLVRAASAAGVRTLQVVSSEETDLSRSPTQRACAALHSRAETFLEKAEHPQVLKPVALSPS